MRKGGVVVCAGIHMSDIPSFPYDILWEERVRPLGRQSHPRAMARVPGARAQGAGQDHGVPFPLAEANEALARLRDGELTGAAVLIP